MARLTNAQDIASLGTIMGVWAHPDDDTFTAGGLILTATRNGQRVICVTATKGEGGVYDESRWPAEQIAETRTAEQQAALKMLGVSEQYWLGYPDGACDTIDEDEAADRLAELITSCKPDTIITFGPDGHTGHADHIAAGKWALAACERLEQPPAVYQVADSQERFDGPFGRIAKEVNYYFNLPQPKLVAADSCDICLRLPEDVCRIKCEALKAQTSQTFKLFEAFPEPDLQLAFSIETFVRAKP